MLSDASLNAASIAERTAEQEAVGRHKKLDRGDVAAYAGDDLFTREDYAACCAVQNMQLARRTESAQKWTSGDIQRTPEPSGFVGLMGTYVCGVICATTDGSAPLAPRRILGWTSSAVAVPLKSKTSQLAL